MDHFEYFWTHTDRHTDPQTLPCVPLLLVRSERRRSSRHSPAYYVCTMWTAHSPTRLFYIYTTTGRNTPQLGTHRRTHTHTYIQTNTHTHTHTHTETSDRGQTCHSNTCQVLLNRAPVGQMYYRLSLSFFILKIPEYRVPTVCSVVLGSLRG